MAGIEELLGALAQQPQAPMRLNPVAAALAGVNSLPGTTPPAGGVGPLLAATGQPGPAVSVPQNPTPQGPPTSLAGPTVTDPTTGQQSLREGNFAQKAAFNIANDPAIRRALQVAGFNLIGGKGFGDAGLSGVSTFENIRKIQRDTQTQQRAEERAQAAGRRDERRVVAEESRSKTAAKTAETAAQRAASSDANEKERIKIAEANSNIAARNAAKVPVNEQVLRSIAAEEVAKGTINPGTGKPYESVDEAMGAAQRSLTQLTEEQLVQTYLANDVARRQLVGDGPPTAAERAALAAQARADFQEIAKSRNIQTTDPIKPRLEIGQVIEPLKNAVDKKGFPLFANRPDPSQDGSIWQPVSVIPDGSGLMFQNNVSGKELAILAVAPPEPDRSLPTAGTPGSTIVSRAVNKDTFK